MFVLALLLAATSADTTLAQASTHVFDPQSGALMSVENEWFDAAGRLLRREVVAADGTQELLLVMRRDAAGRDVEALYFESEESSPSRELWSYAPDGQSRVMRYIASDGSPGITVEQALDSRGRNRSMRWLRTDGTQFGEEEVQWRLDGRQTGWVFRYLDRPADSARFVYQYEQESEDGFWTRRTRLRNDTPERLEVRSVLRRSPTIGTTGVWRGGVISSEDNAELSPSVSPDRTRVLVLREVPSGATPTFRWLHVYSLSDEVEETQIPLPRGAYTAGFSSDGASILYSTRHRTTDQVEAFEWDLAGPRAGMPRELPVSGSYLSESRDGTLYYYDADGAQGEGIYRRTDAANGSPEWLGPQINVPGTTNFAPYVHPSGAALLFTRFVELDGERYGGHSGLYVAYRTDTGWSPPTQLLGLPYGWDAEVTPDGDLIFTDGADIQSIPAAEVGLHWP